jgi:hypothetical protein
VSFLLLVRAVERGSRRAWALYAATAVALVSTGLLAVFVLASQALVLLALPRGRRPRSEAAPALAAAAAAAVAMLVYALARNGGQTSWIGPLHAGDITSVWSSWAGNHVVALLYAVAAAAGLLGIARSWTERRGADDDVWRVTLIAAWLALLPVALLAISVIFQPLWTWPYVAASVPALIIAVALGVRSLRRPALVFGAAALLVAALVPSFVSGVRHANKNEDLRAAARLVLAHARSGDAIAYEPAFAGLGFRYYLAHDRARRAVPQDVEAIPGSPDSRDGREFGSQDTVAHVGARVRAHRRLWLVGYSPADANWHPTPEPFLAVVSNGGLSGFRPAGAWRWGQLTVRLVKRR